MAAHRRELTDTDPHRESSEDLLLTAFVVVTVLAAVANFYAAYLDFVRDEKVTVVMERKGVPKSWAFPLGAVKAAGALGLLIGFAVPLIGTAAAVGLVLFFVCAVGAHLRARYYRFANVAFFLSLAVATLTLNLAHRNIW